MEEFLRNILTRRNWFLGTVAVVFFIYVLANPEVLVTIKIILWQIAGLAIAIVGIRMILGYKPWWLGGGSSAKKKGS